MRHSDDTGLSIKLKCLDFMEKFDWFQAYWKHTRGLLHTQKVMEAEKDNNTSQTMDEEKGMGSA